MTQPTCADDDGTTEWGWFIFSLVMLVALAKDLISGVKLFYLAFSCKNNRYFAGGFILILVTLMSMWASYKYNRAIATKNTELLMNSVVLLFVQEIDEWMFQLVDGAFPSWTNAKLEEANILSESTLSISAHWGSSAGTPSFLPFGTEGNEESKVKKDITTRYWGNGDEGLDPQSNPTKSVGCHIIGTDIKQEGTRKANKEVFKDDAGPDRVGLSKSLSDNDNLTSNNISNIQLHDQPNAEEARPYPAQVSFNLDTGSIGEPERLS